VTEEMHIKLCSGNLLRRHHLEGFSDGELTQFRKFNPDSGQV